LIYSIIISYIGVNVQSKIYKSTLQSQIHTNTYLFHYHHNSILDYPH